MPDRMPDSVSPASPAYLVLQARFLAGTYGGAEWPPAPFRLLQAMVAGLRGVEHPGLRWYETQPAPIILAEPEPAPVRLRRSVLNNADPGKPKAQTTLRAVHQRRVEHPVHYFYPLPAGMSARDIDAALQAAHAVHTLGLGEDMCVVQGLVTHAAPQAGGGLLCWKPVDVPGIVQQPGEVRLNVPLPGSLQALEARFQAFQTRLDQSRHGFGRPVVPPALHGTMAYHTTAQAPRWAVVPLRLVQPGQASKPARFHAEHAVVVAGMLRHATMRLAKVCQSSTPALDGSALADFAAGYGPADDADARLSWVPLPSVGHQQVDGMVRRALLMARVMDTPQLSALLSPLPADGLPLVDEHTGVCLALAQPIHGAAADADGDDAVLQHYLQTATTWCTVTPMVMPGDHAGSLRLLTRLLHKALREAGIDPGLLAKAEFSKQGFLRQAVRIRDLKLKAWKAKHLELQHVQLHFSQPLRGPIVLGRGRHYGLGLFCAKP